MVCSVSGFLVVARFFFFFQAEDGIRDVAVTGFQTCALPIWRSLEERGPVVLPAVGQPLCARRLCYRRAQLSAGPQAPPPGADRRRGGGFCQIGRASCRERV